MFSPIYDGNVSLSEIIAEQIKNKILTGKLKPGDKIPSEKELCEMFNVSRTPIREAVKILSSQGFVTIKRGVGVYIEEMFATHLRDHLFQIHFSNEEDFNDVMRVRRLLEISATVWASQNATQKDIQQMEEIVRESEASVLRSVSYEELDSLNTLFHIMIVRSSGSKALIQIMNPFWALISESRKITLKRLERKIRSVEGHRAILEAIKSKNAQEAENAMREHLEGVSLSVHESRS